MGMRRLILFALAGALLFACLLFSGCGEGGESDAGEPSMWLTETSLEEPGAWFTVSVLPLE